jgi:4-aminobutyrate--pyruvate transaminase
MTMAKQLTGAHFPVSAVGISDPVYQVISRNAHALKTFGHGLTYGGHPVGCAVALETLRIYDEMDLPAHIADLSAYLSRQLAPLRTHPALQELRLVGLMAALELKEGLPAGDVIAAMEKDGVILRGLPNNAIAISPPYIITYEEIDHIADVVKRHLDKIVG